MVKSEDEDQFVSDLLRNTSDARDGWIVLYRKADNKFYWLDGRPADGNYEKWNDGEPSDSATRIVCILTEATLMEHGMTEVALTQKIPLPSASGQFRRE